MPALVLRGLVGGEQQLSQLLQLSRFAVRSTSTRNSKGGSRLDPLPVATSKSTKGGPHLDPPETMPGQQCVGAGSSSSAATSCLCNLCELSDTAAAATASSANSASSGTNLRVRESSDRCIVARANDTCPYHPQRGSTYDWGWKLVESLGSARGARYHFERSQGIHNELEALRKSCAASGCAGEGPCSPHDVLLNGLRRLASPTRPGSGASRVHRSVSAAVEPTGEAYVPGVLRIHRPGFNYPLHFDTHHANAWVALRSWLCQEDVLKKSRLYKPSRVREYAALRRHHFSTAAILTLQAPDRRQNPSDLRIYNARGTELQQNCSIKATGTYGIGQRLDAGTFPVGVPYVDLRGDAGDLYLFNSEYVHITPKIRGARSRAVLAAIVGYSRHSV